MPTPNYKLLLDSVLSAATLDAAWALVETAPEEFRAGKALDVVTASTANTIASRLAELNPVDQQSVDIALKWAAKIAIYSTADQDRATRIEIQQTREKVGEWLRELPWKQRLRITPEVVSLAIRALSEDNWKQGCWLLSSIGWRSPEIEQILWNGSIGNATLKGDMLFATLVDLGVPRKKRSLYLPEAHRRYEERKNRHNLHTIYLLSDPSSYAILSNPPEGNETEDQKLTWLFLPQTVARIADRNNTEKVASKAVDVLETLFLMHRAEMERSIYLGGAVLTKCNSRKAVRFLLELAAQEASSPSEHNVMLITRRLADCVASNQVRALNLSRNKTSLKTLFRKVLTKNNDYKGRNRTFDADVKEHLWNLCLVLGTEDADRIGESFIDADQNPYTRSKVLSDLSCLSLNPLPQKVILWASSPSSLPTDNSENDEIQRMESIRVVASAGTLEAFDVLLKSKFTTVFGHTLADSADGLTHLAVSLAKKAENKRHIIDELFKVLDHGPEGPQPGCVSSALMGLSFSVGLAKADYERIASYVLGEMDWIQTPVVRSRLVSALSSAPSTVITTDLITKLEFWAQQTDRTLATSCFETLIEQNIFPDKSSQLQHRLKFKRTEPTPFLQPRDSSDLNGGIYALLANRFRTRYENDFASFLQNCAFGSLVEALATLRRLGRKEIIPFSPLWAQALVQRIIQNNNRYNSESYLFEPLQIYAPATLASTKWPYLFAEWMPETRESLAISLGTVSPDSEFLENTVATLVELQNDTHFGVRRAAFRSLGNVKPSLLIAIADSLSASDSPKTRKLATEPLYWIPVELRRRTKWKTIASKLHEDVAEDVRDALWAAEESARKIQWANKYEAQLLASTKGGYSDVLKRWKFADAISRVGDDQTASNLRDHLGTTTLPVNFQRFLIRTIERLEKNWEKCRKKWPEPFAPGSATTKTGSGYLSVKEFDTDIDYFIWQRPEILDPALISWGGTAKASTQLDPKLLGLKVLFTDSDGESWDVWINSITLGQSFSFVGGDRRSS